MNYELLYKLAIEENDKLKSEATILRKRNERLHLEIEKVVVVEVAVYTKSSPSTGLKPSFFTCFSNFSLSSKPPTSNKTNTSIPSIITPKIFWLILTYKSFVIDCQKGRFWEKKLQKLIFICYD